MNVFCWVLAGAVPGAVHHVFICQLVEDTVTAEEDEVVVGLDFEGFDVRSGHHHVGISAKFRHFRLDVAEGPRHRKPTGQDSVRPQQIALAHIHPTQIRYLSQCLRLINFPTAFDDSLRLDFIHRPVISAQSVDFLPRICAHDGAGVAYVAYIAHIPDNEARDGA